MLSLWLDIRSSSIAACLPCELSHLLSRILNLEAPVIQQMDGSAGHTHDLLLESSSEQENWTRMVASHKKVNFAVQNYASCFASASTWKHTP
jgi:hypothetical protein